MITTPGEGRAGGIWKFWKGGWKKYGAGEGSREVLPLFLFNFFEVYHFYIYKLLYPSQDCVMHLKKNYASWVKGRVPSLKSLKRGAGTPLQTMTLPYCKLKITSNPAQQMDTLPHWHIFTCSILNTYHRHSACKKSNGVDDDMEFPVVSRKYTTW